MVRWDWDRMAGEVKDESQTFSLYGDGKPEIIPTHQFGFRDGHGTIEQVHRLVDILSRALENKASFLSISQAFDKLAELQSVGSLRYFRLKRNSKPDLAIRSADRKRDWHQLMHCSAEDIYTDENQTPN
ncbi:Probable RNA-directed DNA polymerase from transposon BS [Eumeta japonica]|uniref:Probable RNA-directed DNA polymerase from transposon BS n=1 Tax=Eumeta variegata TaxID=151549 RepID=A0A4C1TGU1_EUMVA|nr:Probable RNA-directed DNA polymerase from transposon BS [Eumeta japonica]